MKKNKKFQKPILIWMVGNENHLARNKDLRKVRKLIKKHPKVFKNFEDVIVTHHCNDFRVV